MRERDKLVILPDRPARTIAGRIVIPAHLWDAAEAAGLDLTGYIKERPLGSYDANIVERRRNFLDGF